MPSFGAFLMLRALFVLLSLSLIIGCSFRGSYPTPTAVSSDTTDFDGIFREPHLEPEFIPNVALKESIGNIHFDHSIPDQEYFFVAKDLHALRSMVFDGPSRAEMLQTLGELADTSSHSMVTWLENRVQYILDKDFHRVPGRFSSSLDNFGGGVFRIATELNSQDSGLPESQRRTFHDSPSFGRITLPVPEFEINGIGRVRVTSPRIGVIRLGSGLFRRTESSPTPISDSIVRLSILFHEARHSDGNGRSLCFSHIRCPAYHLLAGELACDENANGPYSVEASFLKTALESCQQCSEYGKEILRMARAEALYRIIGENLTSLDVTPTGTR